MAGLLTMLFIDAANDNLALLKMVSRRPLPRSCFGIIGIYAVGIHDLAELGAGQLPPAPAWAAQTWVLMGGQRDQGPLAPTTGTAQVELGWGLTPVANSLRSLRPN